MEGDSNPTRRGFLLGRFLSRSTTVSTETGATPPAGSSVEARACELAPAQSSPRRPVVLPVLRPPGAIEETLFLAGCTRCNTCLEACPHGAITLAPDRFQAAAGTPMIQPAEAPCRMCIDMPCISACAPAVLTRLLPPKMGTAMIQPHHCLAHQRTLCTVCIEQCPVTGALVLDQGHPRVVADRCTGCGVCQYACPAPMNAILLLPQLSRPLPGDIS